MEMLQRPGALGSLLVMRSVASFICHWAIEFDVSTHFALDLIRRAGLEPPEGASERWPWPVRIRAFGPLELSCAGVEVRKDGRLPQKVMELVSILVAQGARGAYVDAIADALWPDAEGADAKVSLHTTLHRLRRFLQNGQAVTLRAGRLSLDPALCWTDVRAFESSADALLASVQGLTDSEQELARSLLQKYRGQLMPGEDHPWILSARERLHAKFLKLTIRLADTLGSLQDWDAGVRVLERALELDPGNEPLLARLSRLLQQAGRAEEGALVMLGRSRARQQGP